MIHGEYERSRQKTKQREEKNEKGTEGEERVESYRTKSYIERDIETENIRARGNERGGNMEMEREKGRQRQNTKKEREREK